MLNATKEIVYQGRTERYEIVDGYLEIFVGHVHKAESPAERAQVDAAYWARAFGLELAAK